jgi:DNA repair exonuclease SbcCD ATPase subunit
MATRKKANFVATTKKEQELIAKRAKKVRSVVIDARKALQDDDKDIKSVFGKSSSKIQKLLGKNDAVAISKIQRELLKTLVDIMPSAERTYRKYKSERAAYALNALASQARELINDIKADKDTAELLQRIVSRILQPAFLTMAQGVVDELYRLRRATQDSVTPAQRKMFVRSANKTADNIAKLMDVQFNEIRGLLQAEMAE